jgi:hypothetical protein
LRPPGHVAARYVPGDDLPAQETQLPTRAAVEARTAEMAAAAPEPAPGRGSDGVAVGGNPLQHSNTSPPGALLPDHDDDGEVLEEVLDGVLDAPGAFQQSTPDAPPDCWSAEKAPTVTPTALPTVPEPPASLVQGPESANCWSVGAVSGGEPIAPPLDTLPAAGPARLLYDDARTKGFPALTVAGREVGAGEAAWRAAVAELAGAGPAVAQQAG